MENVHWGMFIGNPLADTVRLRYFDKLHLLHPDAELLLAEGLIKWSKPVINFCPDSKVTFTLHASIIKAKDKHYTHL